MMYVTLINFITPASVASELLLPNKQIDAYIGINSSGHHSTLP